MPVPLVFVSRAINPGGAAAWSVPAEQPGVGPRSRVRPAAPGRLLVREVDGSLRALVDGAAPSPASLDLVDVNGPAVSWDGQTVAFAGLRRGAWETAPARSVGGWRIYLIGADGRGLRTLTPDTPDPDLSQFGPAAAGLAGFDDFDPAFLPDGRLCFASTRWRAFAQHGGVRASNLWVVDADGGGLHRITAERNGAERPLVEPASGRLVYARWWRNHRLAATSMAAVPADPADPARGWLQRDGLTIDPAAPGAEGLARDAWQAATVRPDGAGLGLWTGHLRDEDAQQAYGGAFAADGTLIANYFPVRDLVEAAGFGGLRRYAPGPGRYLGLLGVHTPTGAWLDPAAAGIEPGPYATEPEVLPDGRFVFSLAADLGQDYGLWLADAGGGARHLLVDLPGTSELRARVLAARPLPPALPDSSHFPPGDLPPGEAGPFARDGTFTFAALNVYANAAVDAPVVSAPAVGSAGSLRFFLDHQRKSPGTFPPLDWPILLAERPVAPDGSVVETAAPAALPLFEQLRARPADGGAVPRTGGPDPDGAAHVAGMNFAPKGAVARCLGCHAGHTLIPVPDRDADARFSNLAPGARVATSSSRDPAQDAGLVDRRVRTGQQRRCWVSAAGRAAGQWALLVFPVPVTVREVVLHDVRPGEEAASTLHAARATVRLFADAAASQEVAQAASGPLSLDGARVPFAEVQARAVRVELDAVEGTFDGAPAAGLSEVQVIARGEAP